MQIFTLIEALNEMVVNACTARKSGACRHLFNYLGNHGLMENTNFPQNREGGFFSLVCSASSIHTCSDRQLWIWASDPHKKAARTLRISVTFVRF
jgi:hypothetical protein